MSGLIRAAGAVAWRDQDSRVEVLLVHRPWRDDWSLPKGKLDPGERWMEAAVREVEEETGCTGALGAELCAIAYLVDGDPKLVRYWSLRVTGGRFTPNDEVDEVRWAAPDEALTQLSYPTDRVVVASFLAGSGPAADR